MEKIIQFVNQIKGEKVLKGAGIALIVLGVFDALTTALVYFVAAFSPEVWDILPVKTTLIMHIFNFASPVLEILAGVFASYFIRHREKYMFATMLAMGMVLIATFTANLFPDLFSKAITYVSLLPAYLYLFGATKLRESVTYANYDEYKAFYEKYSHAQQEEEEKP